jgi:plasmid stabilization system protein ParE
LQGKQLANRVIQFPVRNAFAAERSRDALARHSQERDNQDQAQRIAEQVESEIAQQAERQASGRNAEFEAARRSGVLMIRPKSRLARMRDRIAAALKRS